MMEMRVNCTHFQEGCVWKGERAALEAHLKSCPYNPAPCPYHCGGGMLLAQMLEHMAVCPQARVECTRCKMVVPILNLRVHEETCLKVPVKCPMEVVGCKWTGSWRDRELHLIQEEAQHEKLGKTRKKLQDATEVLQKEIVAERNKVKSSVAQLEKLAEANAQLQKNSIQHQLQHLQKELANEKALRELARRNLHSLKNSLRQNTINVAALTQTPHIQDAPVSQQNGKLSEDRLDNKKADEDTKAPSFPRLHADPDPDLDSGLCAGAGAGTGTGNNLPAPASALEQSRPQVGLQKEELKDKNNAKEKNDAKDNDKEDKKKDVKETEENVNKKETENEDEDVKEKEKEKQEEKEEKENKEENNKEMNEVKKREQNKKEKKTDNKKDNKKEKKNKHKKEEEEKEKEKEKEKKREKGSESFEEDEWQVANDKPKNPPAILPAGVSTGTEEKQLKHKRGYCPANHKMKVVKVGGTHIYTCDECQQEIEESDYTLFFCSECDYSLCLACGA